MPADVTGPGRRLATLRAFLDELGPLRWVALAVAVVPTVGLVLLLGRLPELAGLWSGSGIDGAMLGVAAIAASTGAVLLPPSIAGFAAGYCAGAVPGAVIAAAGIGFGGVLGQRLFWPLLGPDLYAFMRRRPRVHLVQRFCTGELGRQVLRVALFRAAAKFPFSVLSLLLSAAGTRPFAVWLGTTAAGLPLAGLTGALGAIWRTRGDAREVPLLLFASGTVWALLAVGALVLGRRALRRSAASR